MAKNIGSDFHKDKTILVQGIADINRKLSAAGNDATDMRDLMHRLGNLVISHANVPRDNGTLAATLRSGHGKTKAVVRAGYARQAAYAGVVHYGDPHRGIKAQPYLTDALGRSRAEVVVELAFGLDQILENNNLK